MKIINITEFFRICTCALWHKNRLTFNIRWELKEFRELKIEIIFILLLKRENLAIICFVCCLIHTWLITYLHFSACGLTITYNGSNPVVVVGETGKNITIQWKINHADGPGIYEIRVYAKLILKKRTHIIIWDDPKPIVSRNGKKIFNNRLETDFNGNRFTLKIVNSEYNDRGTYSIQVLSKTFEKANADTFVLVHGMFVINMF